MGSPEGGDGVPRPRVPRSENWPTHEPPNGMAHMPAWVNAVVRVGVPSAIALWFVFRLTTAIEDRLYRMEQIQAQVVGQLMIHMTNSETAINLARQLCINTAKTDEQTSACLR